MSALVLVPFALGETWWGVLGGLIPIIGLALIALVIWRAVKAPEDDENRKEDEAK